jgi:hypothetical protein
MRSSCCLHVCACARVFVCVCVFPPNVARQRLGKSPLIVVRQRLGKIPLIVARQQLGENPLIIARQRLGSVNNPLLLLGNGSLETLPW